jgi:DNA polymerase
VYICNTVKCRAADWSTGRPKNRAPSPQEVAACRRWLLPQLQAVRPWVVLCVGAPSAKNLIRGDFRITAERGKFCATEYAHVALATLHPSYVLRNQYGGSDGGYALMVADIAKAWETATRLRAERGASR